MSYRTAAAELAFQTNPVATFAPVTFSVSKRNVDLQMKVSAPANGTNLPVVILSHGHGRSNFLSSMRGYGPLADYLAAQGFVVIQPTHESSKALSLTVETSDKDLFWRSRTNDVLYILDHLIDIEERVPGLKGRVNKEKIALIGHSMGAHTTGMFAGMKVTDLLSGEVVQLDEPRIRAFVLYGAVGEDDLAEFAREHYPALGSLSYSTMSREALIVHGDKDHNANFSNRPQWRSDAYFKSPGPKTLLNVTNAEHIFGGISGYDANETTDDSPARVLFVAKATVAYLRSKLDSSDTSWKTFQEQLKNDPAPQARIESK
jgi:dienelactone hydrolase